MKVAALYKDYCGACGSISMCALCYGCSNDLSRAFLAWYDFSFARFHEYYEVWDTAKGG